MTAPQAAASDDRQHPHRRRHGGEPGRPRSRTRLARPRGPRALGRGSPQGDAAPGVRGRAHRRADAGHERLRDRRQHQGPRPDEGRPDHPADRSRSRSELRLPRLHGRRRRFPDQAVRPLAAADQGQRLPRPVPQEPPTRGPIRTVEAPPDGGRRPPRGCAGRPRPGLRNHRAVVRYGPPGHYGLRGTPCTPGRRRPALSRSSANSPRRNSCYEMPTVRAGRTSPTASSNWNRRWDG